MVFARERKNQCLPVRTRITAYVPEPLVEAGEAEA